MLKRYKNAIFEALNSACDEYGLLLGDFTFLYGDENDSYRIDFIDKRFYFDVRYGVWYNVEFQPGLMSTATKGVDHTITDTFKRIDSWLCTLAAEVNAPDLWEEFAKSYSDNFLDSINEQPLTNKEQNASVRALENIKAYILENGKEVGEDVMGHIDARFASVEALSAKADRLQVALAIMGMVLALAVWVMKPEDAGAFINYGMEQVQQIFEVVPITEETPSLPAP